MKTAILTREDVRRIVAHVGLDALMDQMIDQLAEALRGFDERRHVVPMRDGFHYEDPDLGLVEWMPTLEMGRSATVKVVGYHPANPRQRELPTILSTISRYDTATGHLEGVCDATFLTALRTGAASAVASRVLARPDSRTLGLIGCGAQAVTHLHALSRVFPIERVLLYDSDPDVMSSFPTRAYVGDGVLPAFEPTALEAMADAVDILCTATSVGIGAGPVFAHAAPHPWLHVNAVGSDFPGKTEVPEALLRRSLVCPDCRAQALREGECQQLEATAVGPDLVELLRDPARFAADRQRTTVFDSTMLLEHARRLGIGTFVHLESIGGDAMDPYAFARGGAALVGGASGR